MDADVTRHGPEGALLAALNDLIAQWTSLTRQQEVARDAGLTIDAGDIQPLYTLGRGGPRRASALADDLRQTRPTMSKQLARLEAAGLIARTPDPADGRASIVSLTDAGARVYTQLVEQGLLMIRTALHDWDAAERADFAAHTTRFVAAVGGSPASAPSSDSPPD